MALTRMTVCNKGDCALTAQFPYQFYAQRAVDVRPVIVNLVMPLGGKETGLYRCPKIGESVLVDDDGKSNNPSYYLIGYLPNEADASTNFLTTDSAVSGDTPEKTALADEQAMVLRYKQTGQEAAAITADTPNEERYSEIGFYHRKTQWERIAILKKTKKALADAKEKLADAKEKLKEIKEDANEDVKKAAKAEVEKAEEAVKEAEAEARKRPKTDQINIQSTGDIRQSAANHYRMKAKRLEILSGLEGTDFSDELKKPNRPFGDKGTDESRLFKGDMHIRARNRIVIKAGTEIRLEVGRSTILIDDSGIKMTSRKTHAHTSNDNDTTLNLLPLNGIQGAGSHINFSSQYHFSISERMGSVISGIAGIMRLGGKDVKLSTIDSVSYISSGIGALVAGIGQIATISRAINDDDIGGDALDNLTLAGQAPVLGPLIAIAVKKLGMTQGLEAKDDTDSLIYTIFTKLLQFMGMILGTLESIYYPDASDKEKDAFALTGTIAELCCIVPIFILIFSRSLGPFMMHSGWIHMDNNGQLIFGGVEEKKIYVRGMDINTPLAGIVQEHKDQMDKNETKRNTETDPKKLDKLNQEDAEAGTKAGKQINMVHSQTAGEGLDEQGSMLKGGSIDDILIDTAKGFYELAHIAVIVAAAVVAVGGLGTAAVFTGLHMNSESDKAEGAVEELDAL
jgi:hypothetical protein